MSPEPTLTDETFIAKLHDFNNTCKTDSYNFSMVFEQNNELVFHPRTRQPCYGELRPYYENGDKIRRPGDLNCPFPPGNPVALGVPFKHISPLAMFMLSEFSPWRKAFENNLQVSYNAEKTVTGFVVLNTKVNADLLVHLVLNISHCYDYSKGFELLVDKNVDPLIAFVLASKLIGSSNNWVICPPHYNRAHGWNYYGLQTGNFDLDPDFTWYNRSAYHRPVIEMLFKGKHTFLPNEYNRKYSEEEILKFVPVIEELFANAMGCE